MAENPISDRERQEIIEKIRKQVYAKIRARKGLAWYVLIFAMVNSAMFAINQAYSPESMWFVWPLAAWGAGLLLHAVSVFGGGANTEALVDAEVQRELARRGLI